MGGIRALALCQIKKRKNPRASTTRGFTNLKARQFNKSRTRFIAKLVKSVDFLTCRNHLPCDLVVRQSEPISLQNDRDNQSIPV